jgi:hypothetical protein
MAWIHQHEGQIRNSKVVILHGKIYGSRPYGKLMDRWIEAVMVYSVLCSHIPFFP